MEEPRGDFRIKVKALILLVLFVAAVPTATRVIDVTGYWVLLVPPALLIASISLLKFEKGILLWGPRDARKECDATLEAPKYDLRKLY